MEENKKTVCGCKSALNSIAEKINWFRRGDRLMIEKKGYIGVSFFRRFAPEKKFLKMNVEPDTECSLFDLMLGIAGIFALIAVIKHIAGFVRFIKCRLG